MGYSERGGSTPRWMEFLLGCPGKHTPGAAAPSGGGFATVYFAPLGSGGFIKKVFPCGKEL